jgi:hypothetical protein
MLVIMKLHEQAEFTKERGNQLATLIEVLSPDIRSLAIAGATTALVTLFRSSILLRLESCFAAYCCKLFYFRRRNKMTLHEIVNGALVFPSSIVRCRHCGGNYHQPETRHCEDKLAAMSPGIMGRLPAQSIDPPTVSVVAAAPCRFGARLERFLDPLL